MWTVACTLIADNDGVRGFAYFARWGEFGVFASLGFFEWDESEHLR